MDKILEMRQKRAALVEQARQLLDAADNDSRGLTAEEEQQYDRIMADVDALGKRIEREERQLAFEKDMQASQGTRVAGLEPTGNGNVEKTGRMSQEYQNAFWKALRQTRNALYPDEFRALQIGEATEGGYLVPDEFERTLIQSLESQNVMRGLARVITTSGDRNIPVVSSHGSASWIDEEGSYGDTDEAFSQVVLGAYKVGTLIKVSEELLNDSAFDLAAYIASEFGRRIGAAEESAFVNGDASGKPTGIIRGAQVGASTASASAITSDELIDVYHSLGRPYRQRATWLMADATAKVLRKLKNATTGDYMWQPGLTSGEPDRLLGRPVVISDYVPTITNSAKVIAFGDFSYYWIADRQGTVFQRLNELYAVNGQVGFKAYRRVDGKLILAEAVKVLQMHS